MALEPGDIVIVDTGSHPHWLILSTIKSDINNRNLYRVKVLKDDKPYIIGYETTLSDYIENYKVCKIRHTKLGKILYA